MPPIIHVKELQSTNLNLAEIVTLKKLRENCYPEEGAILWADYQSAGRGQRGNGWESEEGLNLTFSMVLYPTHIPICEQFILSQIVSLGIKDALDKYVDDISIKWPNDIYYKENKIVGILIENALLENKIENTIIGIGININQDTFMSDAPNPISLKNITGEKYNLEEILKEVRDSILSYYKNVGDREKIARQYKNALFRKNGYHLYKDDKKTFEAKIKEIEASGLLVLETREGEIYKYAFKEVKYIL